MSKDELHLFRRQQIEDYRNSGQSAETWCDGNAMKVSTLRYWLRLYIPTVKSHLHGQTDPASRLN